MLFKNVRISTCFAVVVDWFVMEHFFKLQSIYISKSSYTEQKVFRPVLKYSYAILLVDVLEIFSKKKFF